MTMPATYTFANETEGEVSFDRKKHTTMRSRPLTAAEQAAESEAQARTKQRQQQFLRKKAAADAVTAELAAKANQIDAAYQDARSIMHRQNKAKKEAEKLAKANAVKHFAERNVKKTASDPNRGRLLDNTQLSLNQRAYMYSKHHRCVCGMGKNNVFFTNAEGMQMRCDHHACEVIHKHDEPENMGFPEKCRSCHTSFDRYCMMFDAPCGCISLQCARCDRQTYQYPALEGGYYYQWYDRHIDKKGRVAVTIDNVDQVGTDFKAWFDSTRTNPRHDRANFYRSLNPGSTLSYAQILKQTEKVKVEDIPIRSTEPEGGVASSVSAPFTAAAGAIKKAVKTMRDGIMQRLKSITTAVKSWAIFKYIRKGAKLFLSALKYIINSMYDLLWALNPLQLLRLWETRHSIKGLLLALAESFSSFSTHVELSVARLMLLSKAKPEAMIDFLKGDYYLGVLDTYARYRIKKSDKPHETVLELIKTFGSGPDIASFVAGVKAKAWDWIETEKQSGIADFFMSVLKFLPERFSEVVKPLNSLFKEFHPLLAGMSAIGNITNFAIRIANAITSAIFGMTQNNKEWIQSQITSEGNPVHDLVVAYLTYNRDMQNISHARIDDSVARNDFYRKIVVADNYVNEKKRMGIEWVSFSKGLCDRFNVPPSPKDKEYEPTTLYLGGSAGVGKSTVWKVIVSDVVSNLHCKPDDGIPVVDKIGQITHTWNTSSDFQTGMADKKIILYDDFGQNREDALEVLSVISLCTTAATPINTPAISGKEIKGMFCEPDMLVICSNLTPEMASENKLADPNALVRRIDFGLDVIHRYDPEEPEKKIAVVRYCNRYAHLIGTELSLEEARTIYSVLHHNKRKAFKEVGTMVKDAIELPLKTTLFDGRPMEKAKISKLWQLDKDFAKDFDVFVESRKNDPVEKLIPAVKEKWYSKFKMLFNKPKKLEDAPADEKLPTDYYDMLNAGASSSKLTPQVLSTEADVPTTSEKVTRKTTAEFGFGEMGIFASTVSAVISGSTWIGPVSIILGVNGLMTDLWNAIFQGEKWQARIFFRRLVTGACKLALGLAVSVISSYGLFRYFADTTEESGGTRTAKAAAKRITVPEGGGVNPALETMDILFRKASGAIRRVKDRATVNAVFVGGFFVLIPKHGLQDDEGLWINQGDEVDIIKSNWNGAHKTFLFDVKCVVEMEACRDLWDSQYREDLCLYKLPATLFSAEKNIVHHFWNGEMLLKGQEVMKIDFVPWNIMGQYEGMFLMGEGRVTHDQVRTSRVELGAETFLIVSEASYPSRAASCGSLVRLNRQEAPLLGIHVASSHHGSCFHFVTRKSLELAMKNATVVDVEDKYIHTEPQAAVIELLPPESTLHFEGMVKERIFMPVKTDLTPSLIHGCDGPSITAPAPMSWQDPRINEEFRSKEAFWKQLFKGYTHHPGKFVPSDLTQAYESIRDDIARLPKTTGIPSKVLNLDEALNGLNIPDNTRVDMNTSPGWPYVQTNLKKADLIEVTPDGRYKASDRLAGDFLMAVEKIEKGVVPFLPFSLTLKDERVKLAKVEKPKTRIFACGNLVHYLVSRKYFYTRIMQFYHAKVQDSFCFPSLDRLSLDWDRLITHMLEVGWRGFDFDFEFFDKSIQHILLHYATNALTHGMGLGVKVEATLAELMASPVMIYLDCVFSANGTLMSGALLTYLINCLMNELMHRSAWVNIMKERAPMLAEMRLYKQYTRGMRGGDDTITTVNDRVLPMFNGKTVAAFLTSRGMKVTSPTKTDEIPESSFITDLLYLKNKTVEKRGKFLPLPEFASLRESTYWVRLNKNNQDIVKATQDNVICSLRGMYFHGREETERFRDLALEKCPYLVLPTYDELSAIWRAYHHFPGAHADYATKELQEDPIEIALKTPFWTEAEQLAVGRLSPTMLTRVTKPESGVQPLDKISIETAEVKAAPTNVDMAPLEAKNIENTEDADMKKSEQKRVGATIQDGGDLKIVPIMTGKVATQSRNPRAEAYVNDTNWDLAKLEHKFTYIKTTTWAVTDVREAILEKLTIPQDIIVTPAQKAPFDVTRLWKCHQIRIKLVIKGSPFYAGSLGMGFTPFGDTISPRRMINMGALVQKTSQNDGFEFVIPYRSKYGFLDVTDTAQSLGTFAIFVISPLTTGPSNPNNLSVAIYAAIEGSEFKLPEPVPAKEYYSHKFAGLLERHTVKESGTLEDKRTVLTDINSNVCDMEKTMLCAGAGLVGKVGVNHFQDMPNEITQLLKRWQLTSRVRIESDAGKTTYLDWSYQEIVDSATMGYQSMYALWRGSINVRVLLHSDDGTSRTLMFVTFFPKSESKERDQAIQGYSYGNIQQPIQVTVPWINPFFVEFTQSTGFPATPGTLSVGVEGFQKETLTLELYTCVGDDFSLGVFTGAPIDIFEYAPLTPVIAQVDTQYQAVFPPVLHKEDSMEMLFPSDLMSRSMQRKIIPILRTRKEGGIVEFVDRAVATTLPLVDAISDLGNLLDAHMVTEQPNPMQIRNIPYSVAADLPQYTERLKTLNHNGLSLPDQYCFGAAEKETDIHKLLTTTKSWYDEADWKAADAVGTQLFTLYNGPGGKRGVEGQLHDHLPLVYRYWTGSTIFIFDIIATEMHRGQLLFTYNTAPEDIAFADATQTYFATYDLAQGRGTIALQLPYLAAVPFKEVGLSTEYRGDYNATGKLQCFVLNPLRSTVTVSPNVEIIIYKSYGEDFQLSVYGEVTSYLA